MLRFIVGRSGYGKTEYVFNEIKRYVDNSENDILLMTPEQYSFVCERRLLSMLGEHNKQKVTETSFSHLADDINKRYGYDALSALTDGGKTALMSKVINSVKNNLTLFSKKLDSLSFVNSMIKIYDEMKSCNLNGTQINQMSSNIDNEILFRKMNDISLIMNAYDELISNRFLDPADELTRVYNKLLNTDYFKDKIVIFDGFNGFVAQEYKILELVIANAKETIITLCTDLKNTENTFNLFSYVNDSYKIIEKIAKKADVKTKTVFLEKNYRAKNSQIKLLEENLFNNNNICDEKQNDNISVYCAMNISDECAQVCRQIRNLLRQGYQARDIAVITRNLDNYKSELSFAFKKYEIPYYNDERQPIKSQPLIIFVEYLLRCVNFSMRSDDILSLAKTGLISLTNEEINLLENYVYTWNINGSRWKSEFVNHPNGFDDELRKSDKDELKKINNARKKLIEPILLFKNSVKNKNAQTICAQIYYTLLNFEVDKNLKKVALRLQKENLLTLAKEQGRVWDLLMEILNQLSVIIGEDDISLKDFATLFSLIISTEDLGLIPVGLDNVQFGQADRIRTNNPKAVFILGANENEFPACVTSGGLLSQSERKILLENNFKLYSYSELQTLQERYFAYMACCCASEKVFISYIGSGKEIAPSEIINSVEVIFPSITENNFSMIYDIDLVETRANTFELMSDRFNINSVFSASLKEYFKNDEKYNCINSISLDKEIKIENRNLSEKLFGYDMFISASRVEDYYNCPFRYFCKFGLKASPRVKADLDPMQRGTLIHSILEVFLTNHSTKELASMSKEQIKNLVDKYMKEYYVKNFACVSDLTSKFNYNYNRLSNLIYGVFYQLSNEFKVCDFEAKAFELKIDTDGDVKPEVIKLDDGGTVRIRGSVDRLDTYEKDGTQYIRVVDYKSGSKDFKLSDIMYGLNLQMFIYLFSVWKDKNSKYSGIPAGVLYMHSSQDITKFDSSFNIDTTLESDVSKSFKMKGIIFDDGKEIAQAMEHDLAGKYIPVSLASNGDIKDNLASLADLGNIYKKTIDLIAQMGNELHSGNINQYPVKNANHKYTCDFCDYQEVCVNKINITENKVPDYKFSEAKEILKKEYSDVTVDNSAE